MTEDQNCKNEGLRNCPFCGSKAELLIHSENEVNTIFTSESHPFAVECAGECFSNNPLNKTKLEAINNWNRRVSS